MKPVHANADPVIPAQLVLHLLRALECLGAPAPSAVEDDVECESES